MNRFRAKNVLASTMHALIADLFIWFSFLFSGSTQGNLTFKLPVGN
jgi:hypothetical protein